MKKEWQISKNFPIKRNGVHASNEDANVKISFIVKITSKIYLYNTKLALHIKQHDIHIRHTTDNIHVVSQCSYLSIHLLFQQNKSFNKKNLLMLTFSFHPLSIQNEKKKSELFFFLISDRKFKK